MEKFKAVNSSLLSADFKSYSVSVTGEVTVVFKDTTNTVTVPFDRRSTNLPTSLSVSSSLSEVESGHLDWGLSQRKYLALKSLSEGFSDSLSNSSAIPMFIFQFSIYQRIRRRQSISPEEASSSLSESVSEFQP